MVGVCEQELLYVPQYHCAEVLSCAVAKKAKKNRARGPGFQSLHGKTACSTVAMRQLSKLALADDDRTIFFEGLGIDQFACRIL